MMLKNNKKHQYLLFFPSNFALKMSDLINYNNLRHPKPKSTEKSTENKKVIIYCRKSYLFSYLLIFVIYFSRFKKNKQVLRKKFIQLMILTMDYLINQRKLRSKSSICLQIRIRILLFLHLKVWVISLKHIAVKQQLNQRFNQRQ
jgi:hypothetical protein